MAQQTIEDTNRPVISKLGISENQRVEVSGDVGTQLRKGLKDKLGRGFVRSGELDAAIALVESLAEAEEALDRYLPRLRDTGYIWLITHKRGHDSYVNQMKLVPFAKQRGLIDNKTCSIDELRSGIRFVVPRARRATAGAG